MGRNLNLVYTNEIDNSSTLTFPLLTIPEDPYHPTLLIKLESNTNKSVINKSSVKTEYSFQKTNYKQLNNYLNY